MYISMHHYWHGKSHPMVTVVMCHHNLVHSASRNHSIKIYSTDSDDLINSIRYHDGFMGQKIGPTRCLAFHPYKVIYIGDTFEPPVIR